MTRTTIGTPVRRNNNLDIMRLAAALLVIVSHSYPVVGLEEPVAWLNPAGRSWGHFGVVVFFSLSGYLIAGSWLKKPQIGDFWLKRALRIVPGLLAATALTSLVIGALTTNRTLKEYYSSVGTWLYPAFESTIFAPRWFTPPGVFAGNAMSDLNASLWTLPIEVACYVGVMGMLFLRLDRVWVVGSAVVGLSVMGNTELMGLLGVEMPISRMGSQVAILGATFLASAALYVWRHQVPLNIKVALPMGAVAVGLGYTPLGETAVPLMLPYVLLSIGFCTPVIPLGAYRGWDLSYGTYVYAFPIQQAVVYFLNPSSPWFVTVIATVVVLPIAALSWRFVEKPSLRHAHRGGDVQAVPGVVSS